MTVIDPRSTLTKRSRELLDLIKFAFPSGTEFKTTVYKNGRAWKAYVHAGGISWDCYWASFLALERRNLVFWHRREKGADVWGIRPSDEGFKLRPARKRKLAKKRHARKYSSRVDLRLKLLLQELPSDL